MSILRDGATWLDVPLSEVPLTTRSYRCLTDAGYRTLAEVSQAGRETLRALPGFGAVCQSEVSRLCKEYRNDHARRLLASGLSLRQAGREMGVSGEALRKWLEGRTPEEAARQLNPRIDSPDE
jgi:RNA polymerase alpha subunit